MNTTIVHWTDVNGWCACEECTAKQTLAALAGPEPCRICGSTPGNCTDFEPFCHHAHNRGWF